MCCFNRRLLPLFLENCLAVIFQLAFLLGSAPSIFRSAIDSCPAAFKSPTKSLKN